MVFYHDDKVHREVPENGSVEIKGLYWLPLKSECKLDVYLVCWEVTVRVGDRCLGGPGNKERQSWNYVSSFIVEPNSVCLDRHKNDGAL